MRIQRILSGFGIAVLAMSIPLASAEMPPPGTVITKDNMDKYKEVMFPSLEYFVRNGMEIPVIEYQKYEWPPAYKEATEKYSGQVTLSADGRDVQNYVAGSPFPNLTPPATASVSR